MLETIEIYKKDVFIEEWEQALKELKKGDEYRMIADGSWIEWRGEFIDTLVMGGDFIVAIRKVKKIPFPSNDDLANAFRSVGNSMCINVKMRVTPEQSAKIQEICFQNGVFWRLQIGAGGISYTNEPFLFIDKEITFEEANEEHYFRTHRFREVLADLFIRTNGTCEEEVTEPQDKTEQAHRQAENLDGILVERGAIYGDYGIHVEAVGDIMNILQNVCEKKNNWEMPPRVKAMNFYVVSKLVRLAATPIHEDSLKDAINYLKLMYKEIHGEEIQ